MTNIIPTNTIVTMSSLEIAERTGKEHKHVLRDIRVMLENLASPDLDSKQYQTLTLPNGMTQEILLDKELTLTLVTGYDVKLRHAVVKRWQELEAAQPRPLPPPPPITTVLPPPPPLSQQKAPTKAQLAREAAQRTQRMQREQHQYLLARRKVAQLELDIARIDMQLLGLTSHYENLVVKI